MYVVTTAQLFNNNCLDVQFFDGFTDADAFRSQAIDALCRLYPKVDFNTHEALTTGYSTVSNDADKKPWLVIRLEEKPNIQKVKNR